MIDTVVFLHVGDQIFRCLGIPLLQPFDELGDQRVPLEHAGPFLGQLNEFFFGRGSSLGRDRFEQLDRVTEAVPEVLLVLEHLLERGGLVGRVDVGGDQ